MEDSNRLPPAMIPSFVVAAPVPATPVEPLSTSSHMVKPGPVQTRTIGEEGDSTLPGTKGKEVLRTVVEPALRQNTREKAVPKSGTGSKQTSTEFFTAESGPYDCSRPIAKIESGEEVQSDDEVESDNEQLAGINLSGETYLEGWRVDTFKVPQAERQACGFRETHPRNLTTFQTCGYCTEHNIRHCYPTWYPSKNGCDMRCQSCINKKQDCSFRRQNFGIVKWPKVIPSTSGDDLRKADAESKRDLTKQSKKTKKKKKELKVVTADEPKDIFEVDDPELGASLFNKQAIPVTMPTTPSPSTTHVDPLGTAALTSHSAVVPMTEEPTESLMSRNTSVLIWYAELVTIDRLVSNSWLSRVALEAHRSEARSARQRERDEAEMVLATLQDRRAIWEGLLAILDASIELERE
jgi:hypothetical protein